MFLLSLWACLQVRADYVEIDNLGYQTNRDGTAVLKYPVVKITANSVIFPDFGHLVLPETIEYKERSYRLVKIDETVFKECPTITGITFNEGLETIGDETFIDCPNLKEVHFSSTLKQIGVGVFEGTPWLNDQPTGMIYAGQVALLYKGRIPDGTDIELQPETRYVATSAFYGQRGMASFTAPEGLLGISSGAFCSCKGMTRIDLPSTLTDIGNDCFRDCLSLTALDLPDGIEQIGSYAFINCTSLQEVHLPAQLKDIQFQAFENCAALTAIELPAGLKDIGRRAFYQCEALRHITVCAPEPPLCAHDNVFTTEQYDQAQLVVPAGSLAAYQQAKAWKNFKNITESAPTAIHSVGVDAQPFSLQGAQLRVDSAVAAQGFAVYSVDGKLLYTGHDCVVALPSAHCCIVRIGAQAYKVLVP